MSSITGISTITGSQSISFTKPAIEFASAIFSLRKLKTTATVAIRVRRNNDNTEQDIGFTLAGDLDQTSLSSFVGANNGYVTTWYDQSDNNLDGIQATTTAQPRIVNAGTIDTLNGKPCLVFDGGDFLVCGNSSLYCTSKGEYSCFGVAAWNDLTARILWDADDNLSPFRLGQFFKSNGAGGLFLTLAFDNAGNPFSDTGPSHTSSQILMFASRTLTALDAYVDNVSTGGTITTGTPKSGTTTKVTIGAFNGGTSSFFLGSVQEIIHFGSASDYRTELSADINSYYTIY